MKFKAIYPIILAATAMILLLAGCSSGAEKGADAATDKPTLAASIEPQRYLVERLAGPAFSVVTIMDDNASPESFEPSMQRRRAADRSPIYFSTGLLPFEQKLTAALPRSTRVVNTSEGIDLIYGTHEHGHEHGHGEDCDEHDGLCDEHGHGRGHGHEHGAADPHVWSSTVNAKIMARNIADALCMAYPDSTEVITERLEVLLEELDSTDEQVREILADSPTCDFVIWHPSLSYFARDLSLNQIAADPEGKEISLKQRRAIIDRVRSTQARTMLMQKQYDARQAKELAKEMGVDVVEINPLNYDLPSELIATARAIAGIKQVGKEE